MKTQLTGKTLYGFGDSLVAGHCNRIGMLTELAQQNQMNFYNYAINGASVLPKEPYVLDDPLMPETVYDIAQQIRRAQEKEPDFVCFDGLTNDAYEENCIHPGNISSSFDGDYDTSCFAGAFEMICYLLKQKYPNSSIYYICPHKMPTRTKNAQETLQKLACSACRKWNIPFIDVYHSKYNTCVEEWRIRYSYNGPGETCGGNGTHLNPDGYRLMYAPLILEALQQA